MDPNGEAAAAALELCRNCEQPVHGEFCSSCGQRTAELRRPLLALLHELVTEIFELDGRLRRTLRPFLLRPGWLSREFREGRRARYTSPLRLYIATSLLCFSMIAVTDCVDEPGPDDAPIFDLDRREDDPRWPSREAHDADPSWVDRFAERLVELDELSPAEQTKRLTGNLSERMPKVLVVLVPVFALICGLLTLGRGFLYIDHLVFALHVHAVWFVAIAFGVLLPESWEALRLLAMASYGLIAFKQAYQLRWPGALWRAAIGTLLYGTIFLSTVIALVVVSVLYE